MTKSLRASAASLVLLLGISGCAVSNVPAPPAAHEINTVMQHMKEFSVDDNPIDDPGSPGEVKAIQYAANYLHSLGLQTIIQSVPLTQIVPNSVQIEVRGPKGGVVTKTSASSDDFIVWPGQQTESVSLEAGVVFAGYGIVAPEFNRDDFKTVDVKGKVVVVLEGSPRTGDRDDLGELGETYYGTRFYKFAEAARHGAAAVLIVHTETTTPWSNIRNEQSGAVITIDDPPNATDEPKALIEGWLSAPAAERLFAFVGVDHQSMYQIALELAFRPIDIPGLTVSFNIASRKSRGVSQDVIAILPGETSDYIVLAGRWNRIDPTAWAHLLGQTHIVEDDGSGAATVMEAAAQLTRRRQKPLRTIVFMITTALKPGILGLQYYIDHPPPQLPLANLSALIFLDQADMKGANQRVGKIGEESDGALAQITREAAIERGRLVELDPSPEKRFYYGFSQTALSADGVRVIYLSTRPDDAGKDRVLRQVERQDDGVGANKTAAPISVAAAMDPTRDAELLATIVLRVATATNWPPRIEPVQAEPTRKPK